MNRLQGRLVGIAVGVVALLSIAGPAIAQDYVPTPPDTVITSGPAPGSTTEDVAVTFEFSSPDADTVSFECDKNGGGYVACISPRKLKGLNTGTHTFSVRAIDSAGNVDPTPATVEFNLIVPAEIDKAACNKARNKLSKAKEAVNKAQEAIQAAKTDEELAAAKKALNDAKAKRKAARKAKRKACIRG